MYRFLLSRQWVILTLLGLVLIPVMIKLGFWQFHRHEHRVAQNQVIAASLAAKAVPVGSMTSPGHEVPGKDMWHPVTATGAYDTDNEVVVRRRMDATDQNYGFYVITPLRMDDGRTVLVNRGWVPSARNQADYPKIPAPPSGKVTVTGRLKADETTEASGIKDKSGLPPRQVMLINSEQRAKALGRPVLGGYIEISEQVKGQPEVVPEPEHDAIGPHMAYAIQWWLFAAAVPVGWVVLARRERKDRAETAAKEAAGAQEEAPADGGSVARTAAATE